MKTLAIASLLLAIAAAPLLAQSGSPRISLGAAADPKAELSATSIDFGAVGLDDLVAETITLSAASPDGLRVDSIWIDNGTRDNNKFYLVAPSDPFPIAIAQGTPLRIVVAFRAKQLLPANGRLNILTNDPGAAHIDVPITASVEQSTSVESIGGTGCAIAMDMAPNPLRGAGRLTVRAPRAAAIDVSLEDGAGRVARSLFSGRAEQETFTLPVDTEGLAAGVYFCVARSAGATVARAVVIVR
jgi:hypothetical protein